MAERFFRAFVVPLFAVIVALGFGMLFLRLTGYPAVDTFRSIIRESFQDWYGFGQVLRSTTLLIFTGLAVAIAFQAGLFNIGVEGQLYIGSLAIGIAGYYIKLMPRETVADVPTLVWFVLMVGAAMIAGGLWGAIPGVLKAATGAHEVITTIMMNFIALSLINYLLRPEEGSFAVPATLHTPSIPSAMRVPRLSKLFPQFEGSTVSYSLFVAITAAIAVYLLLRYTKMGYEIRAVGKNPMASQMAGILPGRVIITSMVISGGVAGLVGIDFVLGYKGYFEEGFSAGLGFLGIAVALLANNHPIGVIFTAFLFGILNYGKVAAAGTVPKDIIEIMEAVIIFCVIIGNRLIVLALDGDLRRRARRQDPSVNSEPSVAG